MNPPSFIILEVAAAVVILMVAVAGILLLRGFIQRLQNGQGPMGSVLRQSREVAKEAADVARERLQVEKEMLAVQKETNGLLRQIITQLDKKT